MAHARIAGPTASCPFAKSSWLRCCGLASVWSLPGWVTSEGRQYCVSPLSVRHHRCQGPSSIRREPLVVPATASTASTTAPTPAETPTSAAASAEPARHTKFHNQAKVRTGVSMVPQPSQAIRHNRPTPKKKNTFGSRSNAQAATHFTRDNHGAACISVLSTPPPCASAVRRQPPAAKDVARVRTRRVPFPAPAHGRALGLGLGRDQQLAE